MTYAFVMDVPAPIEFYDALHAEIARRTPGGVEGILLHVARRSAPRSQGSLRCSRRCRQVTAAGSPAVTRTSSS
jgi:hypothetical protein